MLQAGSGESKICSDRIKGNFFLLSANDLFKVINNDDVEVIITEDQPEEIADLEPADPKVRFFHQFIHPSVHALRFLYYLECFCLLSWYHN